jgi:hypothetical protein
MGFFEFSSTIMVEERYRKLVRKTLFKTSVKVIGDIYKDKKNQVRAE